ncbi:GNAT family N-acetyltransferase [Lachnospiraceae bacterium 54-53]
MKKLTGRDYRDAMDYILKEPEFNLFIIGDLEIYGLDDPDVAAYTSDSWNGGTFPYFLLDYRNNYVFYSHEENFPAEEVAEFLSGCPMKNLSGKKSLIQRLLMYLKDLELVPTYMARLDSVSDGIPSAPGARRLTEEDIPAILNLLFQIGEFYTLKEKTPEENREDIRASITHGGRMYGIIQDDVLVSVAGTTAENSMSAMVVSVGTLPAYRKKGYATSLVARLCGDCLKEGMKFLCLFYHNPEAGHIYRKLGFSELGQYAMVRTRNSNG